VRTGSKRPRRSQRRRAPLELTAVARHAHIALSRLKTRWKADGKTEAEIHTVIPDRSSKSRGRCGGGEGGDPTSTPQ
jgi:hypothetical protein